MLAMDDGGKDWGRLRGIKEEIGMPCGRAV
jgi:hypothetical protein